MARHRMSTRRRIARIVRRIVLAFAALGAAFVALFIYFLVAVDSPNTETVAVEKPASERVVSMTWSESGNGSMIVYADGSSRVAGDCIPDDDDFFYPCADISSDNIDYLSERY